FLKAGDVLPDRAREQVNGLWQVANMPAQFVLVPLLQRGPVEPDDSGICRPRPDQHARQSRFTRSARPDDAQAVSRRQIEIDASQYDAPSFVPVVFAGWRVFDDVADRQVALGRGRFDRLVGAADTQMLFEPLPRVARSQDLPSLADHLIDWRQRASRYDR